MERLVWLKPNLLSFRLSELLCFKLIKLLSGGRSIAREIRECSCRSGEAARASHYCMLSRRLLALSLE